VDAKSNDNQMCSADRRDAEKKKKLSPQITQIGADQEEQKLTAD
jgi:hypothetical protein